MLNKDGQRELAYVVRIDEIKPIPNYDRVEHARVGGWWVIVKKDQFQVGDPAIYIEVDSKVPEKEPFMFLEKKHFKVKTQKMCKVISQGLLMHPNDFGWDIQNDNLGGYVITTPGVKECFEIGDFLTQKLEITYAEDSDNKRKAPSADKYKKMAQRRPDIFRRGWARWMMKRNWGKKVMFLFFGKQKDKKNGWPAWVVKTDEERCQNMPWLFPGDPKEEWIATEKIDGTSTTFTMKGYGKKREFYICSRNVVFDKPDKKCFYETNVYTEMAEKYNIESKMRSYLLENPDISFVCWQGEICAPGIQKNPHALKDTHLYLFHMTDSKNGRYDIREAKKIWDHYLMESVPIILENYILPDDFEELKLSADGMYSAQVCEGNICCEREGYVYYKTTDPTFSFKNVSRNYLLNRG